MAERYKRTPNAICLYCGKSFYKRPCQPNIRFCSRECRKRYEHEHGIRVWIDLRFEELGITDVKEFIEEEHWQKGKSIKQIAEELRVNRQALMTFLKKTRNTHADN